MDRPSFDSPSQSRTVLVTAGEFFLDLVFYDLESLPDFGEELKTDNFAFTFGGGAAISGAAAALLGRNCQLMTAWGDSPLDKAAQERLAQLGLKTSWSRTVPGKLSGLSVAVSTRKDRFFLTAPGANREVEPFLVSGEFVSLVKAAGHLHFALTPISWEPFEKQVKRLHDLGVTLSWDMGWDVAAAADSGFRRLCRELEVLFLNDKEIRQYSQKEDLRQAAEWFRGRQQAIVIKCGRQGAVAATLQGDWIQAPSLEVDSVDSTGAGDAFNGGFLHAWMNGAGILDCLRSGNVCGALSTRVAGGIDGLPDKELHAREMAKLEGGPS